jgi:uncharacterized protein (DUF169 family)
MSGAGASATEFAATFRNTWPERPRPVGWARLATVPADLARAGGPLVAACRLWQIGADRVVVADSEHGACVIGRLTMGFADSLPDDDPTLGAMLEVAYIDVAEVPSLPRLPRGHAGIVYGPLDELPVEPEAVLLQATAEQAMILTEALGLARLDAPGLPMMGRPTCAAIPAALEAAAARGSLACTGARLYAGFDPGDVLVVLPAALLDGLSARLEAAVRANAAVAGVGRRNLAAVEG